MSALVENPIIMFMALFALYSPVAAVSSYFPIVSRLSRKDQRKLAIGLFTYVTVFAMVAIWIGEPLLELLGVTVEALTVTGGIALLYAAIPLMRGVEEPAPKPEGEAATRGPRSDSWRSVLFMPVTFPLTVGGTTFAILVSFRGEADTLLDVVALSIAAVVYAAVTGITVYASGHLERRVKPGARSLLERIAGILLTAIGVSLLASGVPRMVVQTLESMR